MAAFKVCVCTRFHLRFGCISLLHFVCDVHVLYCCSRRYLCDVYHVPTILKQQSTQLRLRYWHHVNVLVVVSREYLSLAQDLHGCSRSLVTMDLTCRGYSLQVFHRPNWEVSSSWSGSISKCISIQKSGDHYCTCIRFLLEGWNKRACAKSKHLEPHQRLIKCSPLRKRQF